MTEGSTEASRANLGVPLTLARDFKIGACSRVAS